MNQVTINSYLSRQLSQVKLGGWPAVSRKTKRILSLFICLPIYLISFPLVFITRIVKPFIHIRFGPIRNDVIGHFVFDLEYYLSWKELESFQTVDLFYFQFKRSPNSHWPKMVRRAMFVHPLIKFVDKAYKLFPGWQCHFAQLNDGYTGRDTRNVLGKTKCHIPFTDFEHEKGRIFLERYGMELGDKFVCVINRDTVYKEKFLSHHNQDWSYHSYRNSDISNYQKTIDTLAEAGLFVLRMGKGVSGTIDDFHPRIIDYANSNFRSDFLDIYLFANAFFTVGGEAGIITVNHSFRKPICFVNLAAIEYIQTWKSDNINILKKYWLTQEKRYMTFKEIYKSGAGKFLLTEQYDKLGIELIENTPDEILDVSVEMQLRLNGTWETEDEDEALQRRFWELFPKNGKTSRGKKLHGEIHARIGADWLRQNRELLK